MTSLALYLFACCSLFLASGPGIHHEGGRNIQPGEWLLFETLDLQLEGPCYDVAFYRDDIVFMKAGEELLHHTPMLRPDPGSSQPLFVNRDISCSPAAISFTSDFARGYYTRPVMGNEQVFMEKIFEMSIEGKQVSGISQLSFSSDPSRNLHPAVSSDGTLMVFSSDRLPTSGGLDLFVSMHSEEGWSEPVNLGESINTSGHEWFPYLDRMNNLWFSSTGHNGYGGFDIYLSLYSNGAWGLPLNLGSAINGPQNELGFSVHPEKQVALFSRTWPSASRGSAIMISLNEGALDAAGIDEAAARDIILLIQGMSDRAPQEEPVAQTEQETVSDPVVKEAEPAADNSQDPVVFRVQIISSLYENSFPTILIDGMIFRTYEYFYLGSYRICVGEFYSLEEANAFRLRCLDSGFKQAFVAAFRGGERVTDPAVFKQ